MSDSEKREVYKRTCELLIRGVEHIPATHIVAKQFGLEWNDVIGITYDAYKEVYTLLNLKKQHLLECNDFVEIAESVVA